MEIETPGEHRWRVTKIEFYKKQQISAKPKGRKLHSRIKNEKRGFRKREKNRIWKQKKSRVDFATRETSSKTAEEENKLAVMALKHASQRAMI